MNSLKLYVRPPETIEGDFNNTDLAIICVIFIMVLLGPFLILLI